MTAVITAIMKIGNAQPLPDSYTAEKIASLLQNPVVMNGAPISARPAAHMNAYVFLICFRKPPISVINRDPTTCNSDPAAMKSDALNIACEIRWKKPAV